jgi:hypothetical protein
LLIDKVVQYLQVRTVFRVFLKLRHFIQDKVYNVSNFPSDHL